METRAVPKGYKLIKQTPLGSVYGSFSKLQAIGYKGEDTRHTWYFRFESKKHMEDTIEKFFLDLESSVS